MNKTIVNKQDKKRIRKIVFSTIVFFVFLISGIILLNKSVRFETQRIVKYNETSNIDYKVYLIKNDFYEKEYLDKDMLYVASLIDKIKLNFKYKFKSEIDKNVVFNYSVYGTLSITNPSNHKSYYEKTYTLLEDKTLYMSNSKEKEIDEEVEINYQQYNQIANSFKRQFT